MPAVACMLPIASHAQDAVSETVAMSFLSMSPDARSNAMGGVYEGAGAFSHFSNPAAVGYSDTDFKAAVSYQYFQPDVNRSHSAAAGAIWKINDRFGATFGFLTSIGETYDVTSSSGYILGDFTPADYRAGLGVSYKFMEGLTGGLALNYAASSFGPEMDGEKYSAHTAFADIQMMYRLKHVVFSLGAYNLGLPVKSDSGETSDLPANVRIGVTAGADAWDFLSIKAGMDLGMYLCGPSCYMNIGAEFGFKDLVFVRLGAHSDFSSDAAVGLPSYSSVGLGGKLSGFRIDVSYVIASGAMKNTFGVTLGYSF